MEVRDESMDLGFGGSAGLLGLCGGVGGEFCYAGEWFAGG